MKILYNDNEGLKILTPAIDIDIKIIADKDVPKGLLYKIIDDSLLPDRSTRSSWEADINESNCDGIGLSKNEFKAKYPQYSNWAVIE
jgi:hypothetical protein